VTDPETKKPRTASEAKLAHPGFLRQLTLMIRAISSSPVGKKIAILLMAIVLVILATAYGQIRLNSWNKPFYDAISRRDLREFLFQLGVFFVIAGCILSLNVTQRWLSEMLQLRLREGLVRSLLKDWLMPGVHSGSPTPVRWGSIRTSAFTRMRENSANSPVA